MKTQLNIALSAGSFAVMIYNVQGEDNWGIFLFSMAVMVASAFAAGVDE